MPRPQQRSGEHNLAQIQRTQYCEVMTQSAHDAPSHDDIVASMTGGMVGEIGTTFTGSDLLRSDGRPRPEFRAELRTIDDGRNGLTTITILLAPIAVSWIALAAATWWITALAVVAMGMIQTRMYILHHEAAHRLLFSNRTINDLIGINILGWLPLGTGTHQYRRGHANHHRDEFGPNEPDFLLYAFYPISKRSMQRKLRRDATGVSGYRMLKPLFTGIKNPEYRNLTARFLLGQFLVAAAFVMFSRWWQYPLLWVLPYFTWYQVQNRLRSIAEHGGMTRSTDRRETTHHVEQHWLPKIFMAPHNVGYHLAHHVDSGIPFRNLPVLHRALRDAGYLDDTKTWPNYRSLWASLMRGTRTS